MLTLLVLSALHWWIMSVQLWVNQRSGSPEERQKGSFLCILTSVSLFELAWVCIEIVCLHGSRHLFEVPSRRSRIFLGGLRWPIRPATPGPAAAQLTMRCALQALSYTAIALALLSKFGLSSLVDLLYTRRLGSSRFD